MLRLFNFRCSFCSNPLDETHIDSTKLQRELGWRPAHTDFAEGLKQTIDWYVANESWWRPAKEATEARYRARGR